MRKLLTCFVLYALLLAQASAQQGTGGTIGTIGSGSQGALSGLTSNTLIDVSSMIGADFCIKLRTAFQQMSATGASNGFLDARTFPNPQYCSVNPFFTTTNQQHPFVLLLGEYDIYTSVPWVIPRVAHRIIGAGDSVGSASGHGSAQRQGTWIIACNPKAVGSTALNDVGIAPSQCDTTASINNTFPQGANGLGAGKEETGTGYENVFYSPHGLYRGVPTIVLGRTGTVGGGCALRPGAYLTEANITASTGAIGGTPVISYGGSSCTNGNPAALSCEFANSTGSGATCTTNVSGGALIAINITAAGTGYTNGLYAGLFEEGVGDPTGCMNTPVLATGACDGTSGTGGGPDDLFMTEVGFIHFAMNGLPNVFGLYSPNMQEGSWLHDLMCTHYADARQGDNNACVFGDTAISGGSQFTHSRLEAIDSASTNPGGANGRSGNGWGIVLEGAPTYIDIPQGTCESKPRGFVSTFTGGNPSAATLTYNGGANCTNGAPTTTCRVFDRLGATANITTTSWAANVATVVTSQAHNLATNDIVSLSRVANNGYNGIVTVTGSADSTHFTYALTTNPGGSSSGGFVGKMPYDSTYMGTTCSTTVAGGVVTAITVSGGSGNFRNASIKSAPFVIRGFTCQGNNPNGMAGCIAAEGINDLGVQGIHAESMGKQPASNSADQFRISANMGTVRETLATQTGNTTESTNDVTLCTNVSCTGSNFAAAYVPGAMITITGCNVAGYNIGPVAITSGGAGTNALHYNDPTSGLGSGSGCTASLVGPYLMGANLRLGFGNAPVQGGFISNVDGVNDGKWASVYLGAGNNQDTVITSISPNAALFSLVDDNNCATNTSAIFPCGTDQGIRLTGAKVELYSPQGLWIVDSLLFGLNGSNPNASLTSLTTGATAIVAVGNGTKADESAYVRSGDACRVTADITLSNSATNICSYSLGTGARSWQYKCDLLWAYTAVVGGTPTLSIGLNYAQTPTGTTNVSAEIKTTNTGTATEATVALSASGALNILTSPTLTPVATVFQASTSGTVLGSATSGAFAITATAAGTTPTAAIKAGSQCQIW